MDNLNKLKELLDNNKIENQIEEVQLYEDEETCRRIVFKFPVAREFEEFRIYEDDNIESIVNSNFLKYRGISNYEAIWSNELSCIECEVMLPKSNIPNSYILKRLSKYLDSNGVNMDENGEIISLNIYSSDLMNVSIGYSSDDFLVLNTCKERRFANFERDIRRRRVTLKISNIKIKTQEEAKRALEKISNTIFYQLDILYEFLIMLSPRRETRIERRQKGKRLLVRREVTIKEIELKYEYDEIPMALYWFAQSSSYSPIFKYFALYQVIEYYYPIYATINAKTKIQNLLKDPKFSVNKDSDILRLLTVVKMNSNGSIGDEREQLNITLRNVVAGEDIIEYISERTYLSDYYKGKASQKLSEQKLRLNDKLGIMDDIATRIYDIRCSIVHNKASETDNKILPMTKDVELLVNDVELLEFIAKKVIIANSRPFSL